MTFKEAVKGKKFKCDNCKEIFEGNKIVLKPTHKNMSMFNPMLCFIFVDQSGKLVGGSEGPSATDKVAHCPKCDYPHLFGFNEIE